MTLQPTVDSSVAVSVRTLRNETNARLLRIMATTANMDDPDRLAALRDDLRFVFDRHASSVEEGVPAAAADIDMGE